MAIDWSVWGPPALVLAIGAGMGIMMMSRLRGGGGDPSILAESRRLDLESTKNEVLEQLKQLEYERDKLPPEEYQREREALLARGARALEALDNPESSGGRAPDVSEPRSPQPRAEPREAQGGLAPEWKGALYALGAVLILALLWQFASSSSRTRGEGESATGFDRGAGGAAQMPPQQQAFAESEQFKQERAALEARIAADPNDIEAHNRLTDLFLGAADYGSAMQQNDLALKVDATNADARTYRGMLTLQMGMPDKALEQFEAVISEHPGHVDAIIMRSIAMFRLGQHDEAISSIEAALQANPNSPELQDALGRAKAALSQVSGAPPPPMAGGPAGDLIVSGTVQIDPAAAAGLKGTETLFISASNPGQPGPPVAADKVEGPLRFPVAFDLTTADIRAMPGAATSLPPVIDVKVRIDLDGNAMTRETAPLAVITGVRTGSAGLALTLTMDGAPTAAPSGLVAPLAPGGAPPAGGAPEVLAEGTAKLGPNAALSGGEVVFVSVKDPKGGPPLASLKVPAQFPLSFRVTTADILQMAGPRTVPDAFDVAVRVDRDGNAMTRDNEPEAVVKGVKKGISGLDLTLQ